MAGVVAIQDISDTAIRSIRFVRVLVVVSTLSQSTVLKSVTASFGYDNVFIRFNSKWPFVRRFYCTSFVHTQCWSVFFPFFHHRTLMCDCHREKMVSYEYWTMPFIALRLCVLCRCECQLPFGLTDFRCHLWLSHVFPFYLRCVQSVDGDAGEWERKR